MFDRILIANRGEIAMRIIRAARELGMTTVAVHSTVDAESPHVRFADESVCIGPPAASESYLNIPALIAAAEISGAQAIHPGYGFLSENPDFAEVCESCGLTWIGPPPAMIRLMGNKVEARRAMAEAGLPLLPGSPGPVASAAEAESLARELGLPVILKAAAGGGGRGMKIVRDLSEVAAVFETASHEARAAFGNGEMYLERYVERPRHIEIQVIADTEGHIIHLGERECSVQRRHQKLLEESPSPAVSPELREEMGQAAVEALRSVGYASVGTVEFLLDEEDRYYFMETNTRIQVEHPVTEMVTGFDLVREQIRLAAGDRLGRRQEDISFRGHAIEARINAEDPETFVPSPGVITGYHPPGGFGVRVDATIYEQYRVLPYYDSLLAKLVVYAENREVALARLDRALGEMVIEGISTNIPFHRRLLEAPAFREGRYSTRIVEEVLGATG